jgi:hypothetical protein
VKDLLQGDGPIGKAVQRSAAPSIKAAIALGGPLVVEIGEALPYVKEIIPILKTLVDMYKEQGLVKKDYAELTNYLERVEVFIVSVFGHLLRVTCVCIVHATMFTSIQLF